MLNEHNILEHEEIKDCLVLGADLADKPDMTFYQDLILEQQETA